MMKAWALVVGYTAAVVLTTVAIWYFEIGFAEKCGC